SKEPISAKRCALVAVAAVILFLFIMLYPSPETSPPPPGPPNKEALPEKPEPIRPSKPARSQKEELTERAKKFEEAQKKEHTPPPKEPLVRWVGPLSLLIQISAPPLPSENRSPKKDAPGFYLSQLPIPVEIWVGRVPQQEIPPMRLDLQIWKSAITIKIANELDATSFLAC